MKNSKKVKLLAVCMIVLCALCMNAVFAQSNEFVTGVIQTEKISYGQATYLVMCDLGHIGESASESEAIFMLEENYPKLVNKLSIQKIEQPLTAKQLSQICCTVYNVKTSLMYMIAKNQRYAFRQMKAMGYFSANDNPSSYVSGRKALMMIADCSEKAKPEKSEKPKKSTDIPGSMMMSR